MMKYQEQGFTLIEMMVTMGIGLVIMAGMTSVFVSQTRTAAMLKNKTEAMGDLFLASQIMQGELRSAKQICSTGSGLVYQATDSATGIAGCTTPPAASNGSFELRPANATHPTAYLCWDRPNDGTGCQEVLRGMPTVGGLTVTVVNPPAAVPPLPVSYEVTMKSLFRGQDNQTKPLGLTFKVWARN